MLIADAIFEAVLGVVLLILAIAPTGVAMASPAGPVVIVAVAMLLLIIAVVVLLLSARPTSKIVSGVALGNATSAFILAFWLAARWKEFSSSGQVVVSVTIAGLLLLAVAELISTMPRFGGEPAD